MRFNKGPPKHVKLGHMYDNLVITWYLVDLLFIETLEVYWINEWNEARGGFVQMVARGDVGVDAQADGVGHFRARCELRLKFAREPRFVRGF